MQLERNTGAGMSCSAGRHNSRTITTVARSQVGPPVRPVQGSELVAMVDRARRSPRSAPPNSPGSPSEQLVAVVTLVITAWRRNSPDEPPVCARHM